MAKKILVFVAAIMALAVVPAAASATNSPELVETTAGGTVDRLATGSLIQGTNTAPTKMTNASGEVLLECETATMTGSVTKNDGSNVEGNITANSFINDVSGPDCSGILGPTLVTANPATNGLNWCLRSTSTMATDEFQVRGNSCASLARPIRFVLDVTFTGQTCIYQRTSAIPGTFTTGHESVLSISGVEFPLAEGSSFGCPSKGFLDMSFLLETDGTTTRLGLV